MVSAIVRDPNCLIAVLTCAGGRESKRSLFARLPVFGNLAAMLQNEV